MNELKKRRLSVMDGGIMFLIAVTLLLMANLVFAFFIPEEVFDTGSYYVLVGAAELLAIGIPALIYILAKKVSIRSIFKRGISLEQGTICAFIAIFMYPVLGLINVLWSLILGAFSIPYLSESMPAMNAFWVFVVGIFAVSLIPGFSEEILFRGVIQEGISREKRPIGAILIASVFFMLMHGDVYMWAYTFAAGIVLGYIYYYTGSLWATVVYHAVNNLIGVVVTYLYSSLGLMDYVDSSYSALSQSIETLISVIILLVASVVCIGIIILLFWGLSKVTNNPRPNKDAVLVKSDTFSYVPYILAGAIMFIIAVLPEVISMLG